MFSCEAPVEIQQKHGKITPAAERTKLYLQQLKNKNIALVVNQTSTIGQTHLVDTLLNSGIKITKVFTPEHGFRGTADAGQKVEDENYQNLKIISLYGKGYKPLDKDLKDIELVVFDIQDVGVRSYTYISTLHYVMEAVAQNDIPLIVLDRPNPLGSYIDGPILEDKYKSFIGMHPVPIIYGMTIGEYARMINGEAWLEHGIKAELQVIPCQNYNHQANYILPIKPSPNLPNNIAIGHYPYLCLFEGTIVSIGRGTDFPFQAIGHPHLEKGLFEFNPQSKPGASSPKHKEMICYGQDLRKKLPSKKLDLSYLITFYHKLSQQDEPFFLENNFFNLLAGNSSLKEMIIRGKTEDEIRQSWQKGLKAYLEKREKYLIYE